MGGPISGGALAAAVSNAGGLGLIGGGGGNLEEIDLLLERTAKPWGIGFLTWAVTREAIERALSYRPAAVRLNFGDSSVAPAWASEAIDLITDIVPAGELVEVLVSQAELALAAAAS